MRRRLAVLALGLCALIPSIATTPAAALAPFAPLEPADGLVYHGTSPTFADVDAYIGSLGDPSVLPAIEGMHGGVPGTRPQNLDANTRAYLERQRVAGRIPHLSYSMTIGEGEAVDDVIAQTDTYDELIRTIGRAVRDYGDLVFVRIGFEFNGSWNGYHPGVYPVAFRKFVDLMRDEGAHNFVTIWCYEPDAPDDFDAVGADGQPLWYPGDDYVDWFGIDLFQHTHFTEAGGREGEDGPYPRTLRFLSMARERGKPVYLSELAAVDAHVKTDAEDPGFADGQADWALWFEPFFAFLDAHPEIKGFNYMSQDYRGTQYEAFGWGNATIQDNSYVRERWVQRLSQDRFIHASKDQARPTSTFDPPPTVVSNVAGSALTGSATDDSSGVAAVNVTYTNVVTGAVDVVAAVVECDAARLSCTFRADGPATPGRWDANARAQDRAGNLETPGPTLAGLLVLP